MAAFVLVLLAIGTVTGVLIHILAITYRTITTFTAILGRFYHEDTASEQTCANNGNTYTGILEDIDHHIGSFFKFWINRIIDTKISKNILKQETDDSHTQTAGQHRASRYYHANTAKNLETRI